MTVRKHIRLGASSAALLDQTENGSAYIAEVVTQRWRAAQQSLAWLRDEGWSLAQLRAAMEALATSWEQGIGGCDTAAPMAALGDPQGQEGIDERVCRALCLLAGEWWAGNAALVRQMQEPAPPKPKATRRAAVHA